MENGRLTKQVIGYADITHRNGSVEHLEYVESGPIAIGWVFKCEDDRLVIIHPSSVARIEINRYKINVCGIKV